MERTTLRLSALACFLAAMPAAAQQASASLAGIVKDETGKPVSGATIILRSPALFADRVLTTDARGEWRVPLLPLGTFNLVATKDGYISTSVTNMRLGLGMNPRQEMVLRTQAVASQVVEVLDTMGAVQKTDTKVASNYSTSELTSIPTTDRGFFGALALAPGVVNTTNTFRPTIRGGNSNNTMYQVNGAEVKNESKGYFTNDQWFVEDNIEDVQVLLSPLNARMGRVLGGAINVTTKTGSDTFHGSLRANATRLNWGSTRPQDNYSSINRDTISPRWDVTLNGPIIPGRLRFAVATILVPGGTDVGKLAPGPVEVNPVVRTVLLSGPSWANKANALTAVGSDFRPVQGSAIPSGYQFTRFDAGKEIARKNDYKYFEGKLTFAITPEHTVEAGYLKADRTKGPTDYWDDLWNTSAIGALGTNTTAQRNLSVTYRGILSNSLFVEGRYTNAKTDQTYGTGDAARGGDKYKVFNLGANANGVRSANGWPFGYISPGVDGDRNTTANLNFTWNVEAAGNHEVDFGLDYYRSQRVSPGFWGTEHALFRSPGMFINSGGEILIPTFHTGGQNWSSIGQHAAGLSGPIPSVVQYLGKGGTFNNDHQALYVNDQWTLNSHWNVMGGLRMEKFIAKDSDGREVFSTTDFSPRLQVRYDVKGDNANLITFTAARLLGYLPQSFTKYLTGSEEQIQVQRQFTGVANQPVAGPGDMVGGVDMHGLRFVTLDQFYNIKNYNKVLAFADSSKGYRTEGSLKVPYMDEVTLGFAHNFPNNSSFRITFVDRTWKRDWAFAQDYATDQMVLLTDPTKSGLPSMYSQVTRVFNSSDLRRDYQALEMDFTIRKAWYTLGGNWTFSNLKGNHEGSDVGGQMIADYGISGFYNQRRWQLANGKTDDFAPYGFLANDQTHRINLYLTTLHAVGEGKLTTGWFMRYTSGQRFGSTTSVDFAPGIADLGKDANGLAYPVSPKTYTKYFGGRNANTGNDRWSLSCQLNYEVPLYKTVRMFGEIKIDNVLNHFVNDYNKNFNTLDTVGNSQLILDTLRFGTTEPWTTNNYFNGGRSVSASLGFRF